MDVDNRILLVAALAGTVMVTGCSSKFWGGAAVGAAGAGAAYEYQNREALKQLDEDRAAGRISQDEYDRRKAEIEKHSVVY